MKKLLLTLLICTILMTTLVSAANFDNTQSFDSKIGNYGKYEIKDWFGLRQLADLELKTNTDVCGINCNATKKIILYQDGILISDVKFLKLENNKWVDSSIESYQFYILDGNKKIPYSLGTKVDAGIYNVLLEGKKSVWDTVDWQIESQGFWTEEWAHWSSTIEENLIFWYKLDQSTGTVANNSVNSSYNGSVIGSDYLWGNGIINNGLYMNESNTYINVTGGMLDSSPMSYCAWINATDFISGGVANFFLSGGYEAGAKGFQMGIIQEGGADGDILIYSANGTTQIASPRINMTILEGEWNHLCFTWDGMNQSLFKLYQNGNLNASFKIFNWTGDAHSFMLGHDGSGGSNSFNGTMDEIGFWSTNISASMISDLYNDGEGLTPGDDPPTITLNLPTAEYNVTYSPITFNCSASDTTGLLNLTLIIDGVNNYTISNTTVNELNLSIQTDLGFPVGSYNWTCGAVDIDMNSTTETPRNFTRRNFIENNQTYNSTSYETAKESFFLNISSSGDETVTANLIYNGTSYTGTKSGNNQNMTFTRSLNIPTGTTNNNFYWDISVGATSINSSNYNQTINPIIFGLCNSSLTNPYLNISIYDEGNSSQVDAFVDSSTWYYWLGDDPLINLSLSFSESTNANKSYNFCFEPKNRSVNTDVSFQYSASGYPQRRWETTTIYSNATVNQSLYLLSSADGIYVTFQVINQAEQPIEDVEVNATRNIGGEDVMVGEGVTGADGGITFWLNPDYSHTINFLATGYDLYTTTLYPTQNSYTIQIGTEVTSWVGEDYTAGVSYSILPLPGNLLNNTIYNFNLTISSSYWEVDSFGFRMYNDEDTLMGSTSAVTNGGTVGLDLDTGTNQTFQMDFYWVINGTYNNGTIAGWWIFDDEEGNEWSIKVFFEDIVLYMNAGLFGLDDFGIALITFLTIFIFTGIMSYKFGLVSPAGIATLLFTLVLFFDVGLDLLDNYNPIPVISHMPTIIMGIIFIGIFLKEVTK